MPSLTRMSGVRVCMNVSVLMCVTCVASAPVYVCVASAHCSPPAIADTGPQGALWETETGAEDLLEREKERERERERSGHKYREALNFFLFCMLMQNQLLIY